MDDLQRALSQEIGRIIACPYPASLTALGDLLGQADGRMIRNCIHQLPKCGIARVSALVVDSLPLWPYSLPILHTLCQSSEFRDSLLKSKPTLLDSLLAKANAPQGGFDQYTDLCVLLLSSPLPQGVPLPASVQPFFLRLIEQAVHTSDHTSLRRLYYCLNGACRGLVKLLPSQCRRDFDERLYHLTKLHSASEESMLLLWCFGIVVLVERPEAAGGVSDQSARVTKQWRTPSGRKLFDTTKNIYKCMELTNLRVIYLLKGEGNVSEGDVIEGIKIAARTMRFIDNDFKINRSKTLPRHERSVAKLADTILRPAINPDIQFAGLCFYAAITGDVKLPEKLLTKYESLLLTVKERVSDPDTLRELLESSLSLYTPQLQESSIRQLLITILVTILESRSAIKEPAELRNTTILVGVLMNAATTGPLHRLLASALCSKELQEPLQLFLSASIESTGPSETCDISINLSRRELYTNTISMLLTALLAAGTTNKDLMSTQTIGVALLHKQRELPALHHHCSHFKPSKPPTISLFEQGCTPATGVHRQDWRDALRSELERQSHYQHDSIVRSMAQICQNLEDRCNTAEAPLRQEQAKVKELTSINLQLHKRVEEVEIEALDRHHFNNGLEAEIENANKEKDDLTARCKELEAEAEDANEENEALSAKLEELRAKYDRANREADEALLRAQEDLRTKEMAYQATIAAKEECLQSRDRQISELDARKEDLQGQVDALKSEKAFLEEVCNSLRTEIEALNQDLHADREITTLQAAEIDLLTARRSDLEDQLAKTKEKLEDADDENHELEKEIDQLRASYSGLEAQCQHALDQQSALELQVKESEKTLCDLETKHADELAVSLKKTEELEQLQSKLQDAIKESNHTKATCETTARDLELARATVDRLEEEAQQLTDACAEKDDELDELKTMKSQMMAIAMGPALAEPLSRRTNRESGSRKTAARQQRKRKSTLHSDNVVQQGSTVGLQGVTKTAMEDVADASFSSSDSLERNGSTPKRAKTRPSYKAVEMRTPYKQKPNLARPSGTKQVQKRTALDPTSPNRRHTTVGFALSSEEAYDEEEIDTKRRGSLQFGTQVSFDMDRTLGSSPFTPGRIVCGTGEDPGYEEAEDGTVEL